MFKMEDKFYNSWNNIWKIQRRDNWFENNIFVDEVITSFNKIYQLEGPLLDIGCGRGVFSDFIRKRLDINTFEVDFSFESLNKVNKGCILQADCREIPWPVSYPSGRSARESSPPARR